ncbi:MAG TPA: T9SS type A sorting domain-containing protein [Chitinophagaceae bacterium]|nr:T9SS type A sorting domain-containing protein [Chitinophagaceae bacterium]
MNSKKLLFIMSLFFGSLIYISLTSNSSGITGKSSVGCGGSGCHSQNAATTIMLSGVPSGGFAPGNTYTLTLLVTNISKPSAGFDLSVSDGILSGAPINTTLNGNTEIHHTAPLTSLTGTFSWTFNWTAPTGSSAVVFNVAANAVDNSTTSSGDAWSIATFNYSASSTSTPPTILSTTLTGVTSTTADIAGSVNANGLSTSVIVEYGLTTSYGNTVSTSPGVVIGTTPTNVTATITGLLPSTTYHYRIKANSSGGTTNGSDFTLATPTSLNDIKKTDFNIYPNPTNEFLYFSSASISTDISFSAISLTGNACYLKTENMGLGLYKINTQDLAQGNYILRIKANGSYSQYLFGKN